MDKLYKGLEEASGENWNADENFSERRPFMAVLDIGLARATTGARIFGCLKGACDGGLYIPHSTRRYPGASKARRKKKAEYSYKASQGQQHRDKIFGQHIQIYMDELEESDATQYQKQFSRWIKCLEANKTESLEVLYTKVHAQIRANPKQPAKVDRGNKVKNTMTGIINTNQKVFQTGLTSAANGGKYKRDKRMTNAMRKTRVQQKIAIHMQMQMQAEDDN